MSEIPTRTIPFNDVQAVCERICVLAEAIETAATQGIVLPLESNNFSHRNNCEMIRTVAQTIGAMADHLLDGDQRGGVAGWFGLPELNRNGGES